MRIGTWIAIATGVGAAALAVAVDPVLLLLLPAALLVAAMAAFAARTPGPAIAGCYFLVLLAGTKYRVRDPLAVVTGAADAQVLSELVLYGLVLVIVLAVASRLRGRLAITGHEIALAAYVGVAFTSFAWSPVPALSAVRAVQLGVLLLLAIVSARSLGAVGMLSAAAIGCVAYVLAAVFLTLVVPAAGPPTSVLAGGRYAWLQVHPGAAGTYAATGALLLLAFALFHSSRSMERRRRVLIWTGLAVLVLVLLGTRSRGPIIAFAASAGSLLILRWGRASTVALVIFLLCAGFAGLASVGASADDLVRAAAQSDAPALVYLLRGQTAEQFAHLTGRLALWDHALDIVAGRPFFGHGYLSSRIELREFGWAGYAHNGPIQSLLDFGAFGTLLIWGTAAAVCAQGLSRWRHVRSRASIALVGPFALVCFLLINAVISESFAGPPGWDVLLLFASATAAGQHVGSALPPGVRPTGP